MNDNTVTVVLRRYGITPDQLELLAEDYYGKPLETAAFNDPGVRLYEFLPSTLEGNAAVLAKEALDHARLFQHALDSTYLIRRKA